MTDAVKLQRLRDKQLDEYLSSKELKCENLEELLDLVDKELIDQIVSEWELIEEGGISEELDNKLVEIQDVFYKIECDREEVEEALFDKICEIVDSKIDKEFIDKIIDFILL